jgi:hypothetical protein
MHTIEDTNLFVRPRSEAQIPKLVEKIVKHLIDAKDLQRVRALGKPPTPRAKGVMQKLLPPINRNSDDPCAMSPVSNEEFLQLPEVIAIIAIRGYGDNEQMRANLFAKKITTVMKDRNVSTTSIRSEINKFLQMYPPALRREARKNP